MDHPEEMEVELTAAAYGGAAMGRLEDGRAVFVPLAIPGERGRIRLVEERPHYARAELSEVLRASPDRTAPRCRHYGECGGCHYQHIRYDRQLAMKAEIVADQLRRIGGFDDPPLLPAIPSPDEWGYRNNVQFQVDPQGKLGFARLHSSQVLPVRECHLPVEAIQQVWKQVELEPGTGIRQVGLKAGMEDEIMVALEGEAAELPELSIEELAVSVVHLSPAGRITLGGSAELWMEVAGRQFRVSAESFFQVNNRMAQALVDQLLAEMGQEIYPLAMDLYAGVGLFSAFIAPRAARLIAVESSPSACEDFVVNLDEYDHMELYEAAVDATLEYLHIQADLVVADPPRTGLGKNVVASLVSYPCKKLVYISCDPATMARDGRGLAQGGYRLKKVIPFDLFPQTFHIETLSVWER